MHLMRRFYPILFLGVLLAAALLAETAETVETGATAASWMSRLRSDASGPVCAEGRVVSQADPGLGPGSLIFYDPDPVTVSPKYKGPLRFHNVTILGDLEEIEIQFTDSAPVRRFERVASRMLDGDLVSVFDMRFPYSDYRDEPLEIRFDRITTPRLRPSTIPRSRVVRINDRVQYSSHVVNIVWDWDSAAMMAFPAREIAEVFYQHFSDTYEELAFVPARQYTSPQWGARHIFVHNEVSGIGYPEMDERALWSGAETLQAAIIYFRGDLPYNYLSLHETAHQWGFFFDLFEVAGIPNTGPSSCGIDSHVPLVADQPSHLSQCLMPPLRIERRRDKWVLSEAATPLTFHPWMLYAMGLLPPEEVPPLWLATRQGGLPSYKPGRKVPGSFVEVTVDDLLARYGPREGPPVPPVWRRAVIVVSPERLLSRKDIRWYNFFARRISDPQVTGVEDLGGIPSLEFATQGRVDLRTEIRPRGRAAVRSSFEVSYPELGRKDIQGLLLDRKLATRYQAGRVHLVSGRVQSGGGHESVTVTVEQRTFTAAIGPDGRFAVEILLTPEDRGPRTMEIWLGDRERLLARVAPVYVE